DVFARQGCSIFSGDALLGEGAFQGNAQLQCKLLDRVPYRIKVESLLCQAPAQAAVSTAAPAMLTGQHLVDVIDELVIATHAGTFGSVADRQAVRFPVFPFRGSSGANGNSMRQRGQAIAFFTNALRDDPASGKFAFTLAGKHTFVVWEICLGKTYA